MQIIIYFVFVFLGGGGGERDRHVFERFKDI